MLFAEMDAEQAASSANMREPLTQEDDDIDMF